MPTVTAAIQPAQRGITLRVVGLLVGLNLLAHFLPFERASLPWDDYTNLITPSGSWLQHALGAFREARRPLVVVVELMDWFVGDNKFLWVSVVFAASSVLTVSAYFLFAELLGARGLALLLSAFFVVLPNKPQIYYYLVVWFITTTYAIAAASLALYLVYLRSSRRICLWLAILFYGITLFTYEIPFFLPVIAFVAAFLYGRRKWWTSLLFLIPLVLNLLWRTGPWISSPAWSPPQPFMYLRHHLTITLPNLYVGRGMIKWVLYGLARFPTMEFPWVPLLLAADGALLLLFFRWLRRSPPPPVPLRAIPVAVAMAIFFLVPMVMISYIENRHIVMASLGLLILFLAVLHRVVGWRPWALTLLFGIQLVVCQGTAWIQVVACRMNSAIGETFVERKESILQARHVIVDQKSFCERIPYTWVKDPINQMDYYWGIEGLLGRGFQALLLWSLHLKEGTGPPVEVARTRVQVEGEIYTFDVYDLATCQFQRAQLPRDRTVLIDYDAVYPDGFHHGKRRAP